MEDPRYSQEPEYEEYEDYDDDYYSSEAVTSVGLPAGQLALIIGVNAVVSLVISISVVLLSGRSFDTGVDTTAILPDTEAVETVESVVEAETGETETQSPVPEGTPVESVNYTVQPGETLGVIAAKFSVPIFDIMLVNGLTDENFIQSGQELIIPLSGLPTATPTFTPVPLPTETPLPFNPPTPVPTDEVIPAEPAATVGPSPTPTETPATPPTPVPTSTAPPEDEINVVVSELVAPGDLPLETVVILNQGAGTSLKDWTLEGSSLGVFQFPDVFLFSGGSIRIHTTVGQNSASDLYLGQSEAAWTEDSIIIVNDNRGVEVFRYPAAEE